MRFEDTELKPRLALPPHGVQQPAAVDLAAGGETALVSRPERKPLLGYAGDAETEDALRQGLADVMPQDLNIRRGDVRAAIAELARIPTPLTLIVDIAGEAQPLAALEDLSQVVEPDVRVLVIGDRQDLGFYRELTRGLGIIEYLYKPLTPAIVARTFGPIIARRPNAEVAMRGGRVVTVTGARGGVGATTIAANLAWYLAETAQRHTVLLDTDLHLGTATLLLGTKAASGLRSAFEHPERLDELFIERTAQRVTDRLHVLEAEEALSEAPGFAPGAVERLLATLRRRYNFIVVDVPFRNAPANRDVLTFAHQRVVVMDPSIAAMRDALRLMQLPAGPFQVRRPILVLNRADRPGGLKRQQIAETMRTQPDVVIPDLPKVLDEAALLGKPAVADGGAFARAIAQLAVECGSAPVQLPARHGLLRLFRR